MTTTEWPKYLTARVAAELRTARKDAGLTVSELAAACAERGLPVAGTTITNLENGRRHSVDLGEFLVLADALGAPPLTLLFPLDADGPLDALPRWSTSPWEAAAWFTGETPTDRPSAPGSRRELLEVFRGHADAVATAAASTRLAIERRRKATTTLDATRRETLLQAAHSYEQLAFDDCRELAALRDQMRERSLTPPQLPAGLAYIDQSEDEASER